MRTVQSSYPYDWSSSARELFEWAMSQGLEKFPVGNTSTGKTESLQALHGGFHHSYPEFYPARTRMNAPWLLDVSCFHNSTSGNQTASEQEEYLRAALKQIDEALDKNQQSPKLLSHTSSIDPAATTSNKPVSVKRKRKNNVQPEDPTHGKRARRPAAIAAGDKVTQQYNNKELDELLNSSKVTTQGTQESITSGDEPPKPLMYQNPSNIYMRLSNDPPSTRRLIADVDEGYCYTTSMWKMAGMSTADVDRQSFYLREQEDSLESPNILCLPHVLWKQVVLQLLFLLQVPSSPPPMCSP
ncbi:hypothetical protein IWX90DRAFT_412578 [Phyllosticta citrichinensis]|uniref:Uncharacterized protein n=1 Tax=Phyllosticta citrichinensis TaxID=1130410 RepID=A0ABR1Y5B5_9PEZI